VTTGARRYLSLVALLAVVLAACSSATSATFDSGKGKRFVPMVVDWPENVGLHPTMSVSSSGQPFVSYLGYMAKLGSQQKIPESRTLAFPPVPNVMYATQSAGVWSLYGIAKANVTAGALIGADNLTTTPPTANNGGETPIPNALQASAVDSTGMVHAVWTDSAGLEYAAQSSTGFSKPKPIAKGTDISGASIAVDPSGNTWVAWLQGNSLMAATSGNPSGSWNAVSGVSGWKVTKVASTGSCKNCAGVRTAIDVGPSGNPAIAYSDGKSPIVASYDGTTWTTTVVKQGDGGLEISMFLDKSGNYHMAYYANGVVRHAETSPDGWIVSDLATFQQPQTGGYDGWSTSIAVDQSGGTYIAWYDPSNETVDVMTDTGGGMTPLDTPGTVGGQSPSIAVTADGSAMYLAWYSPRNTTTGDDGNLMVGEYGANSGFALAASPAASPSAPAPSTGPPPSPVGPCNSGVVLNLVAPSGASGTGFQQTKLSAPANKCFTIKFVNQDAGVPHNVALYTDSSATTALAPPGAIITGPANETVVVPPLKPGSYFYRCDVHPTVMTGTLVVKG
jgi:hypothetical protein